MAMNYHTLIVAVCGMLLVSFWPTTAQAQNRERRREERRSAEKDSSENRQSKGNFSPKAESASPGKTGSATPAVPGFGSTDKEVPKVPGFSVPLDVPGGNLKDRYDKRVVDRADKETLPRYDKNKDGFLSTEETKEGQWDPPVAESDLDKDGRLSRFELYERYAKKMNLPPKGGVVYSVASTGTAAKSGTSSAPSSAPDKNQVAEYAKGLLGRYDENKNGTLEKDEWKKMKPEHQAADVNGDGVITSEELAGKLLAFASSPSPGASAPAAGAPMGKGGGNSEGNASGRKWNRRKPGETEKADTRKSYRVPSATERLPKGLPDWFARNDKDADGQVLMSEYMTSLTESLAAEFEKIDQDSDGVITSDEALASVKKK